MVFQAYTLFPWLTVRQNIQDYYKKYGKLRRAENLVAEQIAACAESYTGQFLKDYLK